MFRNTPDHYGAVARALHWGMFLLIALMCLAVELRGWLPKEDPNRALLISLHKSCGVLVFILVGLRLAWRVLDPVPPETAGPVWQQRAAYGVHIALYTLMILMPLSGYAMSVLGGRPVAVFGLFELPSLLVENKDLADGVKEVHELGGTLLYGLVAAHAAAALWHHAVLKDTVLTRMAPFLRGTR